MKTYNPTLMKNLSRQFNLKGNDNTDEISDFVQPVVEVQQPNDFQNSGASATTGTISVAVPTIEDFYLTSVSISGVKDVTCDIATGTIDISATVNGTVVKILSAAVLTLTAERFDKVIIFYPGIPVTRNTNITMTGTFTAGALSRGIEISGYTIATTKVA